MQINLAKSCKLSIGKAELVKYLSGSKLSFKKSILAKCFECMNGYADGKVDCKIADCPLYSFMPYREEPQG